MVEPRPIRMQIHGGQDGRIDGILALIEQASSVAPLPDVLQRMCETVAGIAHADVVSVYVREEEEAGRPVFVLRANVGFPREMLGSVRLSLGEGITGFAAECLRPVSADVAERDSHYKYVPELGEERFPSFLAIPLVMGGQAMGVLNLQRRAGGDFSAAEVALSAALASPFATALDRAQSRSPGGDPSESGRSARLTGLGNGTGHAVGKAQGAFTFQALAEPCEPGQAARERLEQAIARVKEQLTRTHARLDPALSGEQRRALAALEVTLQDGRLLNLLESGADQLGVIAGLRKVARDYVTAPYIASSGANVDPWLSARAGEIEDLCLWLAAEAVPGAGPAPGGVSVVAERLGAFAVMAAAARGVAAIVVGGDLDADSLAAALSRAAKLPVVAEVAGLFAWVRAGDVLLVDADQGVVRVNPAASVLARYRHER